MIRGVILDGDGTLVDSAHIWDNFTQECLNELNIVDPDFPFEKMVSASLKDAAQLFITRYHLEKTEDEMLLFFRDRLRTIYARDVELIPGAAEFLAELEARDILAMIATAGDGECICSVLRRYDLEKTCDGVFDCTSVSVGKSEPEMYDLARSRMNFDKDEIMVFEDALYALRCASSNGYTCVAICSPDDKEFELKKACAWKTMPDYRNLDEFWSLCKTKTAEDETVE